jgi:hypothetical protein
MESWTPGGVQVEFNKFGKFWWLYYGLQVESMESRWSSGGVQVESMKSKCSSNGVQVESMESRWNPTEICKCDYSDDIYHFKAHF